MMFKSQITYTIDFTEQHLKELYSVLERKRYWTYYNDLKNYYE
jgi:hypothetical protein